MREAVRKAKYREASRASALGLLINILLGVIKLLAGLATASFALIADAVNSLGDALTSLAVLFALNLSQRPADERHPYGHSRAEAIAGSNVAVVIVFAAFLVGWEAINQLSAQHGIPPWWTLAIAGGNVVIKEGLYHYKKRIAQRLNSAALLANAWDHRADALCALAVLIGLGVVILGGPMWADDVAALVVVTAVMFAGVKLFGEASRSLLDESAPEPILTTLTEQARAIEGVMEIEKLLVRRAGIEYFVDIHVEVDSQLSVEDGHDISHAVKDELLGKNPMVRDVLVHIEPHHPAEPSEPLQTTARSC